MDAQFGGVDQRKIFTFAEKVCDDIVNYVQWLVVTLDNIKGLCDVLKPYTIFCYMKLFNDVYISIIP